MSENHTDITTNQELNDEQVVGVTMLLRHFKDVDPYTLTDKQVMDFCDEAKITPMTAGAVQDILYQSSYDQIASELLPNLFMLLSQVQSDSPYITKDKREQVHKDNYAVTTSFIKAIEESGVDTGNLETILADLMQTVQFVSAQAKNEITAMIGEETKHAFNERYEKNGFYVPLSLLRATNDERNESNTRNDTDQGSEESGTSAD